MQIKEPSALKIVHAESGEHLATARELLKEYADSLGIELCFQNFEQELLGLPGEYAPPHGRLLLAFEGGRAAGCVALRKISDDTCEMKRLYVRPLSRGRGIGRRLAILVIGEAHKIGYQRILLDTLPRMKRAIALYRSLGFTPVNPYRSNPVPGAMFMELTLI